MSIVLSIAFFLVPYLLGSIASSIWISKSMYGKDIRTLGSLNAGSTNMFRQLGFKAGALTQVIDISKGVLAAAFPFILLWLFPYEQHALSHWTMEMQCVTCGMLSVVGHIYPVFAGFRGGKGINTLLGMMIFTNPLASLFCLIFWVLVLYVTRYIAIASMLGVLTYPAYLIVRTLIEGIDFNWTLIALGFCMFLLVVFTHRSNIVRLRVGEEGKNPWFDGRVQ